VPSPNTQINPTLAGNKELKILGIDAGGTFTDFVLIENGIWRIHKVLSTPDNPAKAILVGIEELQLSDDILNGSLCIIHGSTVATNTALENKGAKTVYIANKGFKDILTIGRQARKELYNLNPKPPTPPVPSDHCLEIDCRRDAQGNVIEALTDEKISKLCEQLAAIAPEAVAINLLFSFLNDSDEQKIQSTLDTKYFVSRSSYVLPKYKEYERGIATWLNSSLGPKVSAYMQYLMTELSACSISVMQSSGGTIALEQAANRAVNLLLSGPAGGLSAVTTIGKQTGISKIISFDMGGTSTDVALMDGHFQLTDEGRINDWPIAIPMLDIETIGAGGGSIAWLDEGKMLHVGPQSSGAKPGPACYGFGGIDPTVSDANLVLGRLRPEAFLGGEMSLNTEAADKAISALSSQLNMHQLKVAEGIILIAEQQMIRALQSISIQKGHDPSQFTLCCFGGAGGLHICSLAEQINITKAIIPSNSGVLSAYGMLTASRQRQLSKTYLNDWKTIDFNSLTKAFEHMELSARLELLNENVPENDIQAIRSVDLRFKGQSFTLNTAFSIHSDQEFIHQHIQRYGHKLNEDVELVNICVTLNAPGKSLKPILLRHKPTATPLNVVKLPTEELPVSIYHRSDLGLNSIITGPAIILEKVSTTWLKSGWTLRVDEFSHLHLSKCKL